MAHLEIFVDGDGSAPELAKNPTIRTEKIKVTCLPGGMTSGAPSVGLISVLPDGTHVFAETSLALFLTAADAFKARYGDPRPSSDPAVRAAIEKNVAAALGKCGKPQPCIKPAGHPGPCASLWKMPD